MTEQTPIKQKILEFIAEERWKKRNRLPRWFYFSDGENGYHPTKIDIFYRTISKLIIFIMYILFLIVIILYGVNTPVFVSIRNLSLILNLNELIWIAYGAVLGMAGGLIFQNIKRGQSVSSYILDTVIYILYYDVFFLVLNFVFWVVYLMN